MVPARALIVSLHDAHPGSWVKVKAQRESLREWGVTAASWLVVPEFHHRYDWRRQKTMAEQLTQEEQQGDELVLHGYFHDRMGLDNDWRDAFWTRLYTNQEAEFFDLTMGEAEKRIRAGQELFRQYGWSCQGFIAPGWLMAPGLTELLGRLGFTYTNRLKELVALGPHGWRKHSQSLCYSTRAMWRRGASRCWNPCLFQSLVTTDCIRLSLHPNDFDFPAIRRQVGRLVRRALARGFQPVHYAGYVGAGVTK
jgi:predicted deacetylase